MFDDGIFGLYSLFYISAYFEVGMTEVRLSYTLRQFPRFTIQTVEKKKRYNEGFLNSGQALDQPTHRNELPTPTLSHGRNLN